MLFRSADGALEDAVEERPRGVLGAVPELLHHVVARVVLPAVEQRHRRVEPSRLLLLLVIVVIRRRTLAPRGEEAPAAAQVGASATAGPALEAVTRDSKTTMKLSKIKPTGTRDFNVENPFNKEEKKPQAPASNTSLFRGEVTNAPVFTMCG